MALFPEGARDPGRSTPSAAIATRGTRLHFLSVAAAGSWWCFVIAGAVCLLASAQQPPSPTPAPTTPAASPTPPAPQTTTPPSPTAALPQSAPRPPFAIEAIEHVLTLADNCSTYDSCSTCSNAHGCGWCYQTVTCYAGDKSGPDAPNNCSGDLWNWPANTCANCTHHDSCLACSSGHLCGWCEGADSSWCEAGAAAGPFLDGTPCSDPSETWKFENRECGAGWVPELWWRSLLVPMIVGTSLVLVISLANGVVRRRLWWTVSPNDHQMAARAIRVLVAILWLLHVLAVFAMAVFALSSASNYFGTWGIVFTASVGGFVIVWCLTACVIVIAARRFVHRGMLSVCNWFLGQVRFGAVWSLAFFAVGAISVAYLSHAECQTFFKTILHRCQWRYAGLPYSSYTVLKTLAYAPADNIANLAAVCLSAGCVSVLLILHRRRNHAALFESPLPEQPPGVLFVPGKPYQLNVTALRSAASDHDEARQTQDERMRQPAGCLVDSFIKTLWLTRGKRCLPVSGFDLVSVEAITFRREAYDAFATVLAKFRHARHFSTMFDGTDVEMTLEQQLLLGHLQRHYAQPCDPDVNVAYAFHGTREADLQSVIFGGLKALGRTDRGFFGAGIYCTLSLEYAARYAAGEFSAAHATGPPPQTTTPSPAVPVLMVAVALSNVYPVTKDADYGERPDGLCNFYGKPIGGGGGEGSGAAQNKHFDARVAAVRSPTFQSAALTDAEYVEIVAGQESHFMPVAIIWVRPISAALAGGGTTAFDVGSDGDPLLSSSRRRQSQQREQTYAAI